MVVGIVIWVLAIVAGALHWARSRRRARTDPAARTPQQVWDDTDPEYRKGLSAPGSDGGWGSPL
jgi:hypothetical protein